MVEDQGKINDIVAAARNLKNAGEQFKRIFINKDIHPASRREKLRLRRREREEKDKPENADANIIYDWKNQVLLRNGEVIDRYCPNFSWGGDGRQQ